MTFLEATTRLGRLIRDTNHVQFSLQEKKDAINEAYALIQKEIRKVDPEAHLTWDYTNTVAGTNWYLLPDTFGVSLVSLKWATADTFYTALARKRYEDIKDQIVWSGAVQVSSTVGGTFYTQRGQYIGIFQAPENSVVNGLEIIHSRIMSLSADTDIPKIKTPLHSALPLWSKLLLLGETEETSVETRQRLQEILGDLPTWYNISNDEADRLSVDRGNTRR